jgi:hypothetical protein
MPSPWLSRWPQKKDGAGLGQLNRPLDRAGFCTQFLTPHEVTATVALPVAPSKRPTPPVIK